DLCGWALAPDGEDAEGSTALADAKSEGLPREVVGLLERIPHRRNAKGEPLLPAHQGDPHRFADLLIAEPALPFVDRMARLVVQRDDHVPGLDVGFGGRAPRFDTTDENAVGG